VKHTLPNSDAALQEEGTNLIDYSSAPACPRSGRNSTYRIIQISATNSKDRAAGDAASAILSAVSHNAD
jgi:hypothetical protein